MRLSFHKKNFYRSRRVSKVDNTLLDLNNPSDHTRQSNNFFFSKKYCSFKIIAYPKDKLKFAYLRRCSNFRFHSPIPSTSRPGTRRKANTEQKKFPMVGLLGTLRSSKPVIVSIVSLHVILIFRENHV